MKLFLKKIIAYILQIESRLVLYKYKPKVIAITGSVGKTSTKDAVFAVLAGVSHVRKSEKSFNSEIGLPLTILGIPNGWNSPLTWLKNILKGLSLLLPFRTCKYPKWLVLEVGVGKPGDMDRTASWLKTDVVIITAVGETPAHIEFFESRGNLIEEKSKLIDTLKKDGFVILNSDDPDVLEMRNKKNKVKNITVTYGFKEGANMLGSGDNIFYDDEGIPKGIIFRVDEGGKSLPVVIDGVFGRNHVYAALAALAFAQAMKFNMINAVNSLKNYDIAPGRMRLLPGINDSLIIDDTYNSSPVACESALRTLRGINSPGRKIAVLGDMLELGRHTEEAHRNIGRIAKEALSGEGDTLVTVGHRAKSIREGALEAGMSKKNKNNLFEFLDSREAAEFAKNFAQRGDITLVKGSQGMRMERVCGAILRDQKNKNKLLVRQDPQWLKR